jgi:hypothetical integral membrane protein (TIGR02206 family)|tara:strand:- start:22674 stop:23384 length:711 start_codon:yes stop_codon:yes gene_type:complete
MEAEPFILFGKDHLLAVSAVILTAIFFPLYLRQVSPAFKLRFGYILACILILNELIKPYYHTQFFGYDLFRVLPFHMCALSAFSISFFLITEKRILFEVAFFWGIGGGLMALLQPDTPFDFPDPVFIIFYLSHGGMLLAIGHASIALGNRPRLDSVKRAIMISLVVLVIIYIINLILGPPANFWYLGARPEGASIMDIMPEPPKHIPIVIGLGLIMFSLIYLPYWIYDQITAKNAE